MRAFYASLILGLAATVHGDLIITRSGTQSGIVEKVTAAGVQFKVGENEFTTPLIDIVRADVPKPATVESNLVALRAGKLQDALAGYRQIVDRYAGLPVGWIEDSMVKLGETQIALKDFAGAKRTFETFKQRYPKSGLLGIVDSKNARILFEQGQAEPALAAIQPVVDGLLKKEFLNEDQETALADGLILIGDCQAAAGKKDDALDSYLKVVTLFDVNDERTVEGKYKAGKLLEAKGNWRRAKQTYEELLKEGPGAAITDDIKKRLAAHPE